MALGQPEILQPEHNPKIDHDTAKSMANSVIARLREQGIELHAKEDNNSQKSYEAESHFSTPETVEDLEKIVSTIIPNTKPTTETEIKTNLEETLGDLQEGKGAVIETNNGVVTIRHKNWWLEEDRDQNAIPKYATSYIPVVKEPDYTEQEPPTMLPTHGLELEFQVVSKTDQGFVPIDIQELIKSLKSKGFPISIEGWRSQGEFISIARQKGESIEEYRNRTIILISALESALYEAGYYMVPNGTMVTDGTGQPNMGEPHIRNVMENMRQNIYGENQEKPTGEQLLKLFGANGAHFTIAVKDIENGLYSPKELFEIYNLTHTPEVVALLALFGYSGEYQSKTRYEVRNKLPTAGITPISPLLAEETIQAFRDGKAPSLERASLNGMPHNPIGRQKEAGRIEFTVTDSNYDILLNIDLEHFLSYLTLAIQFNIRQGQSDNLSNQTPATWEDYQNIMAEVQQNGFRSKSLIEAIRNLLNNVEQLLPDAHQEGYQKLKERLLDHLEKNISFEENLSTGQLQGLEDHNVDIKDWVIEKMHEGIQQGLIIRALRSIFGGNETEVLSVFLEAYHEYMGQLLNKLEQSNSALQEP